MGLKPGEFLFLDVGSIWFPGPVGLGVLNEMCKTKRDAEATLAALRTLLVELGLEPKAAKRRIAHLQEGGEGLDFLGFHHRWAHARDPRLRHIAFLAPRPSRQAMQHACDCVRKLTSRGRLRWPVAQIIGALNRFLLGWAGYFHYGNSTVQSSQITRHADTRPALWVAKHHEQDRRYGWQALAARPDRFGLISLNGIIVAPRPNRPWRRGR